MNKTKVLEYFRAISEIPRGSGNTKEISDFCADFARQHGLKYLQDSINNIIIWKPASSGRERDSGIILQGHLDMVNEKKSDSDHDFQSDPIRLVEKDDFVSAESTTLGGDNGIAIAYTLAILDDSTLSHPPLEAVFTVDEEIGMIGAKNIDLSQIKGKYLLNLDSDEEGIFLAGCAGGLTATASLPLIREEADGQKICLQVSGLKGGHSGAEIHKERANADILLGRLLFRIMQKVDCNIMYLAGGSKDNAIPRSAETVIVASPDDFQVILDIAEESMRHFCSEFETADPDIFIRVFDQGFSKNVKSFDADSSKKIVHFLMNCPNGVYYHDLNMQGLVETSLNLGIMKTEEDEIRFSFSVRSSVLERKIELSEKIQSLTHFLGGKYLVSGEYPAWRYSPDSKLLSQMSVLYQKIFGETPQITAIHAGLECGYFLEKCPWLDIVSFGPEIHDIHTTEERMSISSVNRMYKFLIEVLKEIK